MARASQRVVLALLALAAGCRPSAPRIPARAPMVRLGPDRTSLAYDEPSAEAKRVLLDRINRDRAEAGAPAVLYETRAALVGDRFCLEAALRGSWGHWDAEGRAPYLRWALAGGVDYHAENVAAYSVSSGRIDRPLAETLLAAHESMMAERPPRDGHRRTILDPGFTHVGIGVAVVGGEMRMTEEFTRVGMEWVEIPSGDLHVGEWGRVAARPLPTWDVGLVEVRFEPFPRPLGLADLKKRGSYRLPPVVRSLRDVRPSHGSIEASFPLEQAGHYFVVCYLRRKDAPHEPMGPATIALVTARP